MTAHPMTARARLLAEEYDGDWLILSLCDALDGMQEQLDAALCDMADEAAAKWVIQRRGTELVLGGWSEQKDYAEKHAARLNAQCGSEIYEVRKL